jgi:hypothetical protein
LFAYGYTWMKELRHHPSDGTIAGMKPRRLLKKSDGTTRLSLSGRLPYVGTRRVLKKIRWHRRTTLFYFSAKTPPPALLFLAQLVDCSCLGVLGCTNFDDHPSDGTDSGTKLRRHREVYAWWSRSGTWPTREYVGFR